MREGQELECPEEREWEIERALGSVKCHPPKGANQDTLEGS